MDNEIRDPREEGVKGLEGVNRKKRLLDSFDSFELPSYQDLGTYNTQLYNQLAPTEHVGTEEFGLSRYDEDITTLGELNNINEARANLQPWYDKIAAGTAKGAVLAATTFADGVAGTIAGVGNIIANTDKIIKSEDSLEELGNQFISNPVSVKLQEINTKVEDILPNYYTEAELTEPWYENIFTANFIGDKFLKNLGFTIGAAYSGKVVAGLASKAMGLKGVRDAFKGAVTTASGRELNTASEIAKAYKSGDAYMDGVKLTEDLGKAAKKLKNAEYGLRILGATNAAMGEARIEAISNSKEWADYHTQLINDRRNEDLQLLKSQLWKEHPEWFGLVQSGDGRVSNELVDPKGIEEYQRRTQQLNDYYDQGLAKVNSDRAKMANRIFGIETALLSLSDLYQFGRFISGGYNTGRNAKNLVKGTIKEGFEANKNIATKQYIKSAFSPVVESWEEMSQAATSELTGLKYASELNDFMGAKIDPDAESQTIDWIEAIEQGIANTFGDVDRWGEGFLGFITGGIGTPHISSSRREDGSRKYKLSLQGELWEGLKEARELKKESEDITTRLNNRIKDSDFINYYQGIIRHNKYDNDMEQLLDKGDEFNYKNAEHSQLISDAILFDKAGRIQDLYDSIEEAGNIGLEDIQDIREQTVKKDGTSIFDNKTDEEVLKHIQKQANETKDKVNKYVEISNNLKALYGENITSDNLEEMTWMLTQIDDWENRTKSIVNELRETVKSKSNELKERFDIDINDTIDTLESLLQSTLQGKGVINEIYEIINDKNLSIEEGRQRIQNLIELKEQERNTSGLKLGRELAHIKKLANERRKVIQQGFNRLQKVHNLNNKDRANIEKYYKNEIKKLQKEIESLIDAHIEEGKRQGFLVYDEEVENAFKALDKLIQDKNTTIEDMDQALQYAEDSYLNKIEAEYRRFNQYKLKNGRTTSRWEQAKESFAKARQADTSSALFSQIIALKEMLTQEEYTLINPMDDKKINNGLFDLIKLYSARATFIDKYTSLSQNPELFTKEGQERLNKIRESIIEKEVEDTLETLNNIQNIWDLNAKLEDVNPTIKDRVLEAFSNQSNENKELVNNLQELLKYSKVINDNINKVEEEPIKISLFNIVNDAIQNSNSVKEVEEVLEMAVESINIPEISDSLKDLLDQTRKDLSSKRASQKKDKNKSKNKIKEKDNKQEEEKPRRRFSLDDADEENLKAALESDLEEKEKIEEEEDKEVEDFDDIQDDETNEFENLSSEELENIAKGNTPNIKSKEEKESTIKAAKSILKVRSIPKEENESEGTNSEINIPYKNHSSQPILRSWIHAKYLFGDLTNKDIRRATRMDSPIVDALDELGAFDFVDQGHLGELLNKNPDLQIHYVKTKDSRLKNITVLAIEVPNNSNITTAFKAQNGKFYQAIGVLSYNNNRESKKSFDTITSIVDNEYKELKTKPSFFVSTEITNKIKHIYSGRMVKTTDENSPKQKPLKDVVTKPILGVYYKGKMHPDLGYNEEVVPLNSNNPNTLEGSVWLLNREADGRIYAKAVKVKRFTKEEYDLQENRNSPILNEIIENIKILVNPGDNLDEETKNKRRIEAKYELYSLLHFPESNQIAFYKDNISITNFQNNIGEGLEGDEKVQAILEALYSDDLNLRFQVIPKQLRDSSYIKDLLDSNILTTDLALPNNVNASFDLYLVDNAGNIKEEVTNQKGHTGQKGINNTIHKVNITLDRKNYYIKNGEVYDSKDNKVSQKKKEEVLLYQKIKNKEVNPVEGNKNLYLGVYSDGTQFGIIATNVAKIITGNTLQNTLKAIQNKINKTKNTKQKNNYLELLTDKSTKKKQKTENINVGDIVIYTAGKTSGEGKVTKIKNNMITVEKEDGRESTYDISLITKKSSDVNPFGVHTEEDDNLSKLLGFNLEESENKEGKQIDYKTLLVSDEEEIDEYEDEDEEEYEEKPKPKKREINILDSLESVPVEEELIFDEDINNEEEKKESLALTLQDIEQEKDDEVETKSSSTKVSLASLLSDEFDENASPSQEELNEESDDSKITEVIRNKDNFRKNLLLMGSLGFRNEQDFIKALKENNISTTITNQNQLENAIEILKNCR